MFYSTRIDKIKQKQDNNFSITEYINKTFN